MARLYALLVGIDDYPSGVRGLSGAVADVENVERWLSTRTGDSARILVLRDQEATRADVLTAIRTHLGGARSGDTALMWFSGHGSYQDAGEHWYQEPSGQIQTLVCHDSRRGGTDLTDKALDAALAEAIAPGVHTVVVLDCCHSESGSRGKGRVRGLPPNPRPAPPPAATRDATWKPGSTHVELAACRSRQQAEEAPLGENGTHVGVFSHVLLSVLSRSGYGASCRTVLSAVRDAVEELGYSQVPMLTPAEADGIADRPFLGGVERPPVTAELRHGNDGWEVGLGLCHGIAAGSGSARAAFAAFNGYGSPPRPLRARTVLADRTIVEPLGWAPERGCRYPVGVTSSGRAPVAVAVACEAADGGPASRLSSSLVQAIRRGGADGGPSALLRVAEPAAGTAAPLRVTASSADGRDLVRVTHADGSAVGPAVDAEYPGAVDLVLGRLEHVARWHQVRTMSNPLSALAQQVRLEIVEAGPGHRVCPADVPPLPIGGDGAVRLAYRAVDGGFEPPRVFFRLRNSSGLRLWCVLLNLTDTYRIHSRLFTGAFLEPGRVTAAARGRSVPITLPEGRPARPGARVRDWFTLIYSTREFSALPYDLPRLMDPEYEGRPGRGSAVPSPWQAPGRRDALPDGGEEDPAGSWGCCTQLLVTTVR
ncbi:caspase family protein [Streptomyces sparsogenes]|uniref:caspase family protein n=1 Tax=Streptomyces sparsogenes TaxID=67365 RepID=UPI003317C50F